MTAFNNRNQGDATKTEWLTPPHILQALGQFDLDPCAPVIRPWATATRHYTEADNGLVQAWGGDERVWLNPPYDKAAGWVEKLAHHGNGIALIFARTDTRMWFDSIWNHAHALLFLKGRLTFYHVTGEKAVKNGGAPSVLVAYGENNAHCLRTCGLAGKYISLEPTHEREMVYQPMLPAVAYSGL